MGVSVYVWSGLAMSILLHFVFFVWLWYSKAGKIMWDILQLRWSKSKTDKQAVLFLTDNGAVKPMVKNVNDGESVTINDDHFVLNPKSMITLYGAKTQVLRAGEAEPFDPYQNRDNRVWSTARLNRFLMNTNKGEILELLRTYGLYAGIAAAFIILVLCLGIYFDWNAYDVLVQQGSTVVK